mmetsp:Transcript_37039/g.42261  ORF Transcript_37039/g.42261 Transcript_37039/m.42261 type:complete len:146 (+) Transcript_37039:202-639(+)
MKRNFISVKEFLESKFPSLEGKITGGHDSPPPLIELCSKTLTGLQLLTMGFVMFGDGLWTNVFQFRQVPSWYSSLKKYGFQLSLAIFFLIPQMLNSYVVTGAFEILVDGDIVFSKLQQGRLPNAMDVMTAFENLGLTPINEKNVE